MEFNTSTEYFHRHLLQNMLFLLKDSQQVIFCHTCSNGQFSNGRKRNDNYFCQEYHRLTFAFYLSTRTSSEKVKVDRALVKRCLENTWKKTVKQQQLKLTEHFRMYHESIRCTSDNNFALGMKFLSYDNDDLSLRMQ